MDIELQTGQGYAGIIAIVAPEAVPVTALQQGLEQSGWSVVQLSAVDMPPGTVNFLGVFNGYQPSGASPVAGIGWAFTSIQSVGTGTSAMPKKSLAWKWALGTVAAVLAGIGVYKWSKGKRR